MVKANEVVRNIVKEKLARDEVVASMTIRLVRGVEIARMAATAEGFAKYLEQYVYARRAA